MSKRDQLLHVIERDVRLDCVDYQQLRELMQELYQHLQARNCQQIDLVNEQISVLLEQARVRAQRRSKIFNAFGVNGVADPMARVVAQMALGQGQSLKENWRQLNQLVNDCKRLNERNGSLLAMHREIVDQLLSADTSASAYVPQY